MPLADTLLRLAEPPALYEPRWSDEILDEVSRTLIRRFGMPREKTLRREAVIRAAFPAALVENYRDIAGEMKNDPKDRHVLAAAVASRADCLVTFNVRHFPPSATHDTVVVLGPSAFLRELARHDVALVEERLHEQAEAIGMNVTDLCDRLARLVPDFISFLQDQESSQSGVS